MSNHTSTEKMGEWLRLRKYQLWIEQARKLYAKSMTYKMMKLQAEENALNEALWGVSKGRAGSNP